MSFTLPHFNLLASAWNSPNTPNLGAADEVNVHVQLYCGNRSFVYAQSATTGSTLFPLQVRIDPADLGGLPATVWIWEIPQGSGEFYFVIYKQAHHIGFPNEYMSHLTVQCDGSGNEILRDVH